MKNKFKNYISRTITLETIFFFEKISFDLVELNRISKYKIISITLRAQNSDDKVKLNSKKKQNQDNDKRKGKKNRKKCEKYDKENYKKKDCFIYNSKKKIE